MLERRPHDVRRLVISVERAAEYADVLALARRAGVATGEATEADLEKIAETRQHQGICAFARDYAVFTPAEVKDALEREPAILFLDGVGNPHNLGAIVRTAAHFGIRFIAGGPDLPRLSPAAARIAEGGGEFVSLVRAPDGAALLASLQRGGRRIVAASLGERAVALGAYVFPKKCVIVLGGEVEGVSETILRAADDRVTIAGTGAVQSLNVSVSTAIFLHEWSRQSWKGKKGME